MKQPMQRGAQISDCGRYRYNLYRGWGELVTSDPRFALWVMLNPSTADGGKDDATVRKCVGFTKELLGYNALWIVNLFAFRSRTPGLLLSASDPVGPLNTRHISMLAMSPMCAKVIAAWGSLDFMRKKLAADTQARWVMDLLMDFPTKHEVFCLGTSASGDPRHPSRIGYHTPLVPFTLKEGR